MDHGKTYPSRTAALASLALLYELCKANNFDFTYMLHVSGDAAGDLRMILKSASLIIGEHVASAGDLVKLMNSRNSDISRKCDGYKRKISELQQNLEEKNMRIASDRVEADERRLHDDGRIRELSGEVEQLRSEIESVPKYSESAMSGAVDRFEKLFACQAQEIATLSTQRNKLVQSTRCFDAFSGEYERSIAAIDEKCCACAEALSHTQRLLEDAESQLDQMVAEMSNASGLVPVGPLDRVSFVTKVINSMKGVSHETESESRPHVFLAQLESTVRFMQRMVSGGELVRQGPLTCDHDVRTLLVAQCAKISQFINDNAITCDCWEFNDPFDPACVTEEKLDSVFATVTSEDLERPAMREMFSMFVGVVQMNTVLRNRVDGVSARLTDQSQRHELDELRTWRNEIQAQLVEVADKAYNSRYRASHAFSVVPKLLNDWLVLKDRSLVLEKKIVQLESDNVSLTTETKEKIESMSNRVRGLESALKDRRESAEIMEAEMQKDLVALMARESALESDLRQAKEEAIVEANVYAESRASLTFSQSNVQASLEQARAKIHELGDENGILEQRIVNLEASAVDRAGELSAMTALVANLREAKTGLKYRVKDLERHILDIKLQNESIRSRYDVVVRRLENDLGEAICGVDRMREEMKCVTAQKLEMTGELAKLRLSERSMKLKLATAEDREAVARSITEARSSSYFLVANATTCREVGTLQEQLEMVKRWVAALLKEPVRAETPLETQFEMIRQRLEQQKHAKLDENVFTKAD